MARGKKSGANAGGVALRRASMTDSATRDDQCHQKKIFVGGLGHKTTTQIVRDYFKHYGDIVDAVVLRWPDGRSRGFAYVTFTDIVSVNAVLKEAHTLAGCDVDVKRAVPGTNKLFVGGLPQNATAAEMREYFEHFGVVSDAVVMMDPSTTRSRGFGFICFSPGQDGAVAVATVLEQYSSHYLRGKWIEVKSAAPPRKLMADEASGFGSGVVEDPSAFGTPTDAAYPMGTPTDASELSSDGSATTAMRHIPDVSPASLDMCSETGLHGLSTSPTFLPPPGLGSPPGLDCFGTQWPQAEQHQQWAPDVQYEAGARTPTLLPNSAPLPSLLSTGHPAQFSGPARFGGQRGGGAKYVYPSRAEVPGSKQTEVLSTAGHEVAAWPAAAAPPSAMRAAAPLPSLLASGRRHDASARKDAFNADPMKIPLSSTFGSTMDRSADEAAPGFDASAELQRSLEHFLKSQCEQRGTTAAR